MSPDERFELSEPDQIPNRSLILAKGTQEMAHVFGLASAPSATVSSTGSSGSASDHASLQKLQPACCPAGKQATISIIVVMIVIRVKGLSCDSLFQSWFRVWLHTLSNQSLHYQPASWVWAWAQVLGLKVSSFPDTWTLML